MYRLLCILLIGQLFLSSSSGAQTIVRHNTFTYGVNEGLLQSAMLDMAFDRNNFAWISFTNGIQKFDGKVFTGVAQKPGLPEDKSVQFFVTSKKELLLFHSKGITWYDINNDAFQHIYSNTKNQPEKLIVLGESDGIVYFLNGIQRIIGIDLATFNKVSEIPSSIPVKLDNNVPAIRISENVSGHHVCIYSDSAFYLWDLKTRKLISRSGNVGTIPHYASNLKMKSPDEIYFFSRETDLYLNTYNFTTGKINRLLKGPANSVRTFRSTLLYWNGEPYITHYNELYRCTENFSQVNSRIVNFLNLPPAGEATIARTRQDNFGNLYMLTINKGFRKILHQNYPLKYFGTVENENNYYVCAFADKTRNRVMAGAYTKGVFVFDTSQRLIRNIDRLPGNGSFTPSGFVQLRNGNYLVFVTGYLQPFLLRGDLSAIEPYPVDPSSDLTSGTNYFSSPVIISDSKAQVLSDEGLYNVDLVTGKVILKSADLFKNATCQTGSFFLTHSTNELIYIDTATLKQVKSVPINNTGGMRCFLPDGAGNVYIGANKGIFKIDNRGKLLQHIGREKGLPDECIYAMTWGADSSLWCSTNRGILKIGKDLSIFQLRKEDGLQENEFNTNALFRAPDNEIFFAGINGLSSFHPAEITSFPDSLNLFLSDLKINNEKPAGNPASWNLSVLKLPHHRNLVSLEFLAMGFNNPDQYIYQYRMEGIEDEWIQGNAAQAVRYYLNPGKYKFQVFASRQFDPQAKPMKELVIIIKPPFWKSWWFITLVCLAFITLLTFSINQKNKRKYKKQLQVLENEKQIKLERERISRDLHDNLGVYANVILNNSQLLEKEKQTDTNERIVTDLKFASRNIITSLRETVWALNNEEFTAADCMLRIRNFIQPLVRYYPETHFEVSVAEPPQMKLHYTKALNLVRIVQEAITNSIKHAQPRNIIINGDSTEPGWTITIRDDGKGFDTEVINRSGEGNGLYNMKSRAMESGFDLIVKSSSEGTVIAVKVS